MGANTWVPLIVHASMRPGPIRPGDGGRGAVPRAGDDASMRPGPIRPGDILDSTWTNRSLACFNEARADSPGRCFRGEYLQPRLLASMRPGPIRPGDPDSPRQSVCPPAGFNEARADSPGRCSKTLPRRPPTSPLQCGIMHLTHGASRSWGHFPLLSVALSPSLRGCPPAVERHLLLQSSRPVPGLSVPIRVRP